MGQRDRLERIVEALREAQLDVAHWSTASALVDEASGLLGNHLAILRGNVPDEAEVLFGKLYKRGKPDEDLEKLYVENYSAIAELLPRCFSIADGELSHVTDMFTDRERAVSPTYNDFLVATGASNALVTHMGESGGWHLIWQLVHSRDADWKTDEVTMIRRLLPHIRHFLRVRRALTEAGIGAVRATAAAFAARRIGIVLLDREARIVEANDHALALLLAADGLTDRGGYLTTRHAAEADMLARLLSSALGPKVTDAQGGTMPVRRVARPPFVLHVLPLARENEASFETPGECALMVLIVDPLEKPNVDAVRVAQALDLTLVQARVAAALASGGTVRSIAAASHRSEATVRWHLKQITAKLELSGQTDLVRFVLTTPGVFNS